MTQRVLSTRWLLLFLAGVFAFAIPAGAAETGRDVTAVLGPLDEETRPILARMTDKESWTILGVRVTTGRLGGRNVVLAATGVGKVNAAMTATIVLQRFRPSELILAGVAGGLDSKLLPGDVVIGSSLAQHDSGVLEPGGVKPWAVRNPIDGKRNPIFFPCDARLVALAQRESATLRLTSPPGADSTRTPKVVVGKIVTGDTFIGDAKGRDRLETEFHALAVEMEGAAVAQVCHQQKVPFLVLRAVSDKADQSAQGDFERNLPTAASNAAALAVAVVETLAKEHSRPSTGKR